MSVNSPVDVCSVNMFDVECRWKAYMGNNGQEKILGKSYFYQVSKLGEVYQ